MSDPTVDVALPEASPDDYLRWVAFFREVEQKMVENPALEKLASGEGAPFLRGWVAAYLSDIAVRRIADQAMVAKRRGETAIHPRLQGEPELLAQAVDYLERTARWLGRPQITEAMGMAPLEPELVALRTAVIHLLRDQLGLEPEPPFVVDAPPEEPADVVEELTVIHLCPCCDGPLTSPPEWMARAGDRYCADCMWAIPGVVLTSQGEFNVHGTEWCPLHPSLRAET